jgi:lysozyme
MSAGGLALLTSLEGSRSRVYPDAKGLLTIGIGHCLTKKERDTGYIVLPSPLHPDSVDHIPWGNGLTLQHITTLLLIDLARFEEVIRTAVRVDLTQHQYDAMLIFCFNIGPNAFVESTLLKRLNAGDYSAIPFQMLRWVYTDDTVVPGLVARRHQEIAYWNTPDEAPEPSAVAMAEEPAVPEPVAAKKRARARS